MTSTTPSTPVDSYFEDKFDLTFETSFFIIITALYSFNIIFLTISFCLRYYLYLYSRSPQRTPQVMLILNLCAVELICNIFGLIGASAHIANRTLPDTYPHRNILRNIMNYTVPFGFGARYLQFFSLVYIPTDRLIHVILDAQDRNEDYGRYYTLQRTKKLLLLTWSCCIICSASLALFLHFYGFDKVYSYMVGSMHLSDIIYGYLLGVFYMIFFLFSLCIYIKMFVTYARRQRGIWRTQGRPRTYWYAFTHSNFGYVNVLLVCTFLLFTVLPWFIIGLTFVIGTTTMSHLLYRTVSVAVSDFADSMIYIFTRREVRMLVCGLLHCRCHGGRRNAYEMERALARGSRRRARLALLDTQV